MSYLSTFDPTTIYQTPGNENTQNPTQGQDQTTPASQIEVERVKFKRPKKEYKLKELHVVADLCALVGSICLNGCTFALYFQFWRSDLFDFGRGFPPSKPGFKKPPLISIFFYLTLPVVHLFQFLIVHMYFHWRMRYRRWEWWKGWPACYSWGWTFLWWMILYFWSRCMGSLYGRKECAYYFLESEEVETPVNFLLRKVCAGVILALAIIHSVHFGLILGRCVKNYFYDREKWFQLQDEMEDIREADKRQEIEDRREAARQAREERKKKYMGYTGSSSGGGGRSRRRGRRDQEDDDDEDVDVEDRISELAQKGVRHNLAYKRTVDLFGS